MVNRTAVVLAVVLIAAGMCYASDGEWTTLDVPVSWRAHVTFAEGIDGNKIVGSYSSGHFGGFVYDGVTWTKLDVPGADMTYALGIDGNNIVGGYYDGSGNHGFLYDGTTWTTLDAPGAHMIDAYDIDGNNIVGWYNYHSGFLYDGTTWTILDMPGADTTLANGIDGDNIVGLYEDASGVMHGFLYDGITWTTLDMPGAIGTRANGIDGDNIVGWYKDACDVSHGFLYDGTTWTTLDAPWNFRPWTLPYAIDGDKIVGDSDGHGFLYTMPELVVGVGVDIRPGSCPNPLNIKSKGVLPVAILGTQDFDVNTIDLASIRLAGVAAIRSGYEDVSAEVVDGNDCACSDEDGADGFVDIVLKFETQEIVGALGEVGDVEEWILELSGSLYDGTAIEGGDCVVIVGGGKSRSKSK